MGERVPGIFLLVAVFIIATCGLIYELVAASLSSYLLGGSITQFSIVIGVFLSAMGVGSYLTRFVTRGLADAFIAAQVGIGLVGGLSAGILLLTFATLEMYLPVLLAILFATGALVGMEIPLIIRILRSRQALRITVANVLALDYIGALIASCAFPLILVPQLGLLRTALVFGLVNLAVAAVGIRVLRPMLRRKRLLWTAAVVASVILASGLVASGKFTSLTENLLYQDNIILAKQTKYQRIVLTRWHSDIRLFIDGALQLSTVDEHRYHESLVHPAMSALPAARRALIMGGGDGMAARELLKYPRLETIDLVDLDAEMIGIFRDRPFLADLSNHALSNPKLTVHIDDAWKFLDACSNTWDLIVIDLPDPNKLELGRLYTKSFYRACAKHLSKGGIVVTQATSPFYAADAFWCIVETLKSAPIGPEAKGRLNVYPYHAYIPSFGDWGFVMASRRSIDPERLRLADFLKLKFLDNKLLPTLFVFPADAGPLTAVQPNRLDDQILVQYYRRSWRRFGP